jgi:membrane protein DedA with SNARE-associated domain
MIEGGIEAIASMSLWVLLLTIFVGPFIQEDGAVIYAATASLAGVAPTQIIFLVVFLGLLGSDAWKYWLGRLARRHEWAHRFAEKPGVSVAGDLVRTELWQTMLTARFVPGTRIPTYIACGFFKAHYGKYILILSFTALIYVLMFFGLFHTVGAVAGEKATLWMPVIAVVLLAAYILFRWFNHTRKHKGPMTPMTEEFDHPVPDVDHCIEEDVEEELQPKKKIEA